jgi:hypothetical protein
MRGEMRGERGGEGAVRARERPEALAVKAPCRFMTLHNGATKDVKIFYFFVDNRSKACYTLCMKSEKPLTYR